MKLCLNFTKVKNTYFDKSQTCDVIAFVKLKNMSDLACILAGKGLVTLLNSGYDSEHVGFT